VIDPNTPTLGGSAATATQLWNRAISGPPLNITARREYFSKFLIASAGRDGQLGIAELNHDYENGQPIVPANPLNLVTIEGSAGQVDPNRLNGVFESPNQASPTTFQLQEAKGDDITNHEASSSP